MRLINEVLKPFIDQTIVEYFDDILIYSKLVTDHLQYLHDLWTSLRDSKLYLNLKKCEFLIERLLFLEFIVGK